MATGADVLDLSTSSTSSSGDEGAQAFDEPQQHDGDEEQAQPTAGEQQPTIIGRVTPRHASPVATAGDNKRPSVFERLGGSRTPVQKGARVPVSQRVERVGGKGEGAGSPKQHAEDDKIIVATPAKKAKRGKNPRTVSGESRQARGIFATAIETIKRDEPQRDEPQRHPAPAASSQHPPRRRRSDQRRPFEMIDLPDIPEELHLGNDISLEKRHFVRINACADPNCFRDVSYWDIQERLTPIIEKFMPPETTLQPLRDMATTDMLVLWLHCPASDRTQKLVDALQGKTLKFMGVVYPVTIEACVLLHHPKHAPQDVSASWLKQYFKHHFDDSRPGERPDTVHVQQLPTRWFAPSLSQVREEDVAARFRAVGAVRTAAVVRCPEDKEMDTTVLRHGGDAASHDQEPEGGTVSRALALPTQYAHAVSKTATASAIEPLRFEAFVQFERFEDALLCVIALNQRCLSRASNGRRFHAFVRADIDTTAFLSAANVRQRRWRAEEIKRRAEEEEERKRREEETRRHREEEEERERLRLLEEERRREEERQRRKEEKRREKQRRKEQRRKEREERERRRKEEEEQRKQEELRKHEEERKKREEEERMKRLLLEQRRQRLLEEQRRLLEEEERLLREEEQRLKRAAAIEKQRREREEVAKKAKEEEQALKRRLLQKKKEREDEVARKRREHALKRLHHDK